MLEPKLQEAEIHRKLEHLVRMVQSGNMVSLVPFLEIAFRLDNRPYNLDHHYQYEPMFRTRRPNSLVLYTGRQVAKTTFEAADSILMSTCIPNFKTGFITPLSEQARRLSNDRVKKMLEESPIRRLITGRNTENSVFRKTFSNGSVMHFTFALLSADRARGLSLDKCAFDEVQDLDAAHIPVIVEGMSHSKWKLRQYAGTPKTFQNTLHGLWLSSSQAEWVIPCRACKKENTCSSAQDLDKIIGPVWTPGEGQRFLGTICARCRRLIDPADGRWMHGKYEERWEMAGYHIPQHIMHVHYSDPQAWAALRAKRDGRGGYTQTRYFNEVCGEACGTGHSLVSFQELQAAARLGWRNDPSDPERSAPQAEKYSMTVLAVDWGGGGEEMLSLTTMAVLGYLPDGSVHVIWGKRMMSPHDHLGEAAECLRIFRLFGCSFLVHDYSGAGTLRETFLVQNGMSPDKLLPMAYIGVVSMLPVTYKEATDVHPRSHHQINKTRSLLYTCNAIKIGKLLFFRFDRASAEEPGLISDFLGLVENKVESKRGSDTYTIVRHQLISDDFAQAVNMGANMLWYLHGSFPSLTVATSPLTEEQRRAAAVAHDPADDGEDAGVTPDSPDSRSP